MINNGLYTILLIKEWVIRFTAEGMPYAIQARIESSEIRYKTEIA